MMRIRVRKKTDPDPCSGSTTQQLGTVPVLYLPICPDNLKSFQQIIQNVWLHSHENLVDSDMRDILNGSPHEEENNRSPVSAEAPELSSHSSDEVGYLRLLYIQPLINMSTVTWRPNWVIDPKCRRISVE